MSELQPKKQSAKGHKAMVIIGIILLNISLFLAAFVFSYSLILNPVAERDSKVESLTQENEKLKIDVQLMEDQLDVVESELESYKKRYGGSSSSSSSSSSSNSSSSSSSSNSSRSSSSSTGSRDESDEDEDSSESSSGSSERNGDRELNMDND